MKHPFAALIITVVLSAFSVPAQATCACQTMTGSACQIWSSTGADFYWITDSSPSSSITLTSGPCGQSGEMATAYIYSYLNASGGLCDSNYETPCGGNYSWYNRYAKIKVVGNQEAFQHIFPDGLSFTGCFVYWGTNPHYSSLTITETNTECDLKLSSSQLLRIVLNAQVSQCSSTYSGSKFTIQVRFYEARDSEETQFSLLDSTTGSIVVQNNPKTSFDPLNFIPDVKEGTAVGWIEKKTYDLSDDTTDNRFSVTYKSTMDDYCTDVTEGINLVSTERPYTLIPSSKEAIRVKLPGFKRDTYGIPPYASQNGWSYKFDTSDCYIQYNGENGKIIFHCDSPADNDPDNKRYLIRRVEYCTDSQDPDEGDDLWYLNYTYNSPAKIANIHNGSDPNDPNTVNSATIQYDYTWTGSAADVSYKTRPTTSGTWQTDRQWQVEFDDQDRAIKYDAGCSTGCSGSGEFENLTYLSASDFTETEADLTGYEYLIKEKKDPNGVVVLKNTYEIIDFGEWKQSDWLPLTNMDFEFPVVNGCVDQNDVVSISGWDIYNAAQTPHVQICDTEFASGDQSIRPNNHSVEKDFQCYFSPRMQYKLSASIMADNDALNTSEGILQFYYDDGVSLVLLAAIDVNDIASGELVEGQWEDFDVDIACPEDITELTLSDVKLVVTGDYVYIDNLLFTRSVWVAGNSRPMVVKQEVYDDDSQTLKTALTRSYLQSDTENVVTETRYTSSSEYRVAKYYYTDRTFSRLASKVEYEDLSGDALSGDSFTTTYGGDDPNRIFITSYPNGKRADVQIFEDSGNLAESYILNLDNDVNSLRETYTYKEFYGTGSYPSEWRIETHTNAYGGVSQYAYEYSTRFLLTQTDPNNTAGQQEVTYTYDDARRVITETRKLDSERNLRTSYDYNETTGFLDSMTVNGATTHFYHNAFGQVIRQINPDGIIPGKSYGLGGELASEFVISENTADPNGADTSLTLISQTRYTYTDDGKIETVGRYKSNSEFSYLSDMTSANWIITKHEYYADGKKKKTIEDYGTGRTNLTTQYFYNLQGELEKVLYPTGKWVKTTRDGRGLVILEEVGHGASTVMLETAYSYDDNGNLQQQSNPDGSYFIYTYDNYDRLKRTYTGSLSGPYTEKFYNNAGDVIREIACEADGTVLSDSHRDYDDLANVIFERLCFEPNSIDNDNDFTSHFEYDIAGNLRFDIKAKLASSEPNVITTEFVFDNQGRKTQTIDPKGWRHSVYYTDGGLVKMTVDPNDPTDPNAFVTENIFDPYGRLEKTIDPMGHYVEFSYNSLNQVYKQVLYDCKDPNTPDDDIPVRQIRTEYDNLGNITRQAMMAVPNETGSIVLGADLVTDFVFDNSTGLLDKQKTYYGTVPTTAITDFDYDNIGRRIETTDPNGNIETIYYNTTDETKGSQVVKVEQYENDPDGSNDYTITIFFEYDTDGRLEKKILDSDGDGTKESTDQTTQYTFDGLGRIETETADDGIVTFTAYDGFGNVKQTIEDYVDGTPDINHDRKTEFVYNRLNQQYQVKAYDPNETTSQISVQTTTYEFDDNGNVSKIIYPDNEYATYEYGAGDKLITEIKRDGWWIAYWHDWNGNLVQVSDYDEYDPNCPNSSASFIEQFEYNAAGNLTSAYKEIDGSEISDSSFAYNGFGARTSEIAQYDAGISKTTTWTVDGSGNTLTQTHGNTTLTYTHDGLGRIKTIDKGNDEIVSYDYIGRNTESIDYPEADATQLFGYDELGRTEQCKSIDGNSDTILDFQYTYDAVGNRNQCKYNHLPTPVYDKYYFDTLNRLWKSEYGQATPFASAAGNLPMNDLVLLASAWLENESADYLVASYSNYRRSPAPAVMDNDALLARRIEQMEHVLKEAGYRDMDAFLQSAKGIQVAAFNPDDPIYTFAVFPDDVPNNYHSETIYNDENKVIAQIIWDNKDRMVLFVMYPDNGDTVVIMTEYDGKGEKTSEILTTYDADGNATYTEDMLYTAQQAALQTESMSVSSMSIESAAMSSDEPEAPFLKTEQFSLDHLGNRYQYTENLAGFIQTTTNYTHNSVNQYETIDSVSISHDDNGNLSEDEHGYGYTYDYRNRLIEATDSNSNTIAEYAFDALGRRISKTIGSDTVYFFYDTAGRVIAEYDDSATPVLQREYVYGNGIDEVLAMFNHPEYTTDQDDWDEFLGFCAAWLSDPNDTGVWDNAYDLVDDDFINFRDFAEFADVWEIYPATETRYYYLRDALGSTRGLVGGRYKDPNDYEFYNYDVYGKLSVQDGKESQSGNPFLFAGYRFDAETGLYYVNFRTYSPETGRWVQFDPIGNADSMSLYEYCMANPTNYVDPWGLTIWDLLKGDIEGFVYDENYFSSGTDKYFTEAGENVRHLPGAAKECLTDTLIGVCGLGKTMVTDPGKIRDKMDDIATWGQERNPSNVIALIFQDEKSGISHAKRCFNEDVMVCCEVVEGWWSNATSDDPFTRSKACVEAAVTTAGAIEGCQIVKGGLRNLCGQVDNVADDIVVNTRGPKAPNPNCSQGVQLECKVKKPYSNPKQRPKYGKGQVDEVWENAKNPNGKVYDPYTGEELCWDKTKPRNGQWDMGHRYGKSYNKMYQDYMDGKISYEEFMNEYRNPSNYHPQTPYGPDGNRSRKYD
jgi:RHS repeat-associated protein